jgi:hypothetical protein
VEGEQAFKIFESRWKLVIPFHLFGGYCGSPILSERSRPGISLSQSPAIAFARLRDAEAALERMPTPSSPFISARNRIRQRAVLDGG